MDLKKRIQIRRSIDWEGKRSWSENFPVYDSNSESGPENNYENYIIDNPIKLDSDYSYSE